jgi:hypothetical protein
LNAKKTAADEAGTLTQVYNEVINALEQITPDNQHDTHGLLTIVQVLQEGELPP